MTNNDTTPRVWIGCLGCYNAGNLVGFWIDADEAVDVTEPREAFGAHIRANGSGHYPTAHDLEQHEEFWVMDHENFRGLLKGECSPSEAKRIAELIESVESEGYDVDAFAAWVDNVGINLSDDWETLRDGFAEAYAGVWDSVEDFAQNLAEDAGMFSVPAEDRYKSPDRRDLSSEWPFTCIDWTQAYRELRLGGDYYDVTVDGQLYIFRNV